MKLSPVFVVTDAGGKTMTAQSKADLMRRLREQRKAAGLVKIEVWVKPEYRERVQKYVKRLK